MGSRDCTWLGIANGLWYDLIADQVQHNPNCGVDMGRAGNACQLVKVRFPELAGQVVTHSDWGSCLGTGKLRFGIIRELCSTPQRISAVWGALPTGNWHMTRL